MEVLNVFMGIIIGATLGVFGAGGAILVVPYLVYLLGINTKMSITMSLFIVGASTVIGVVSKRKTIRWDLVLYYCPLAVLCTYFGASFGKISSGKVQLIFFAALMTIASYSMWHGIKLKFVVPKVLISVGGAIVGIISGFVGIGGGFLAVPLLSALKGVSAQQAVAVSMVSIVLQSFTGLYGYREFLLSPEFPTRILIGFIAGGALGIFLGTKFGQSLPEKQLKKSFAIFILICGCIMLIKEVFLH